MLNGQLHASNRGILPHPSLIIEEVRLRFAGAVGIDGLAVKVHRERLWRSVLAALYQSDRKQKASRDIKLTFRFRTCSVQLAACAVPGGMNHIAAATAVMNRCDLQMRGRP